MIYWSGDRKLVEKEFKRMGFDQDARWRISDINRDFDLCNTYPRFLIIPSDFKDEDLESVAKYRYLRRIPTAVWRHIKNGCFIVRSSQPTVGWFGWFRNELDEQLVQSYVSNTMPANSERITADTRKNTDTVDINDDLSDQQTLVELDDGGDPTTPHKTFNTTTSQHITTNTRQHSNSTPATTDIAITTTQNNHNNNLSDATEIVKSGNGEVIRLETTNDVTISESTFTSSSSLRQEEASNENHNGNGSLPQTTNSTNAIDTETDVTATTSPKMIIIDARSYTAAMANRAKGGGCECSEYYQRCEVQFMNLANIHSIRKSFHAIRTVCESYSEQSNNWVSFLDNSRWLHHISGLLKSALLIVDAIDIEEKSVLIHCSDGWDRTPQLVALAEIMLDPHYRTFEGFKTLIQREWLDFGHKFADRCGSNPCNEDPNERCPVFLQWLDCVQQLLVQYPRHFEFNFYYLDKLNRHTYSNIFCTFSYNSAQERILSRVDDKQSSLWFYIDSSRRRFRNENYVESDEVLRPSYKVRDLHFWKEVYLPSLRNQTQFMPITNNIDNKKFYDSLYIDGLTRTVCK